MAMGTAADFASPGIAITVPDNSTTTIRATATDAAGNVSGCSPTGVIFVNAVPPRTTTRRLRQAPRPDYSSYSGVTLLADITVRQPPDADAQRDRPRHHRDRAPARVAQPREAHAAGLLQVHLAPGGSVFKCRMDSAKFRTCKSPQSYLVKAGRHTFSVEAIRGGVTDPTPATFRFRVAAAKK